jgi:hypothetical protein
VVGRGGGVRAWDVIRSIDICIEYTVGSHSYQG